MTNIYAWPPVGAVASKWTLEARTGRSQYAFSGKRAVSSDGPSRIIASATVSALARGRNGAGYCEALKRLLDGNVHLVRLYSWPINWHLDAQREAGRQTAPIIWTSEGVPLDWTAGESDLFWFTGPTVHGVPSTDALGYATISLTGLPPSQLIIRPGEFLRSFAPGDLAGVVAQAVMPAYSDALGAATVRLFSPLPAGTISLGDQESAIFEVMNVPEAMQPLGQNWTYQWDFRQVFASEIHEPVEVNPWI